jgi:hypothetical protein
MIAYSYDDVTKEYLGEYRCQADPLDGGFLIPAHATDIKPEQPKQGHIMVFKDEGWVEIEDNRNLVVYDKSTKEEKKCEQLGKLSTFVTKIVPKDHDTHWNEEKQKWEGHEEHLKKVEDDLKKQLEYEASYVFKRRKSYPPLFEQLDALYWDMKNGTDNWIKSRDKVKEQFPKEE